MNHLIANTAISKKIKPLVLPTVEKLGFELIRIKYFERDRATLQIMLDKDNRGIEINECAMISTTISAILDVDDPIENEYDLEISSPGINRPLTREKDFDIWEGYDIKIKTTEVIDNRKNFKGVLRGIKNNEILLEVFEGIIGLNVDWIEEAHLSISIEKLLKTSKVPNLKPKKKSALGKCDQVKKSTLGN